MLARESGWVNACQDRIDALGRGKLLFPDTLGDERVLRDSKYDKEIRQWKRKLFWAKYGYIRAAFVGTALGGAIGYFLITLLPL
jgi:hypothetical protein